MKSVRRTSGFTLVEVMVVVAILGIITAFAYPSYMSSVRKSNRSDAKAGLAEAAQKLQRCYTMLNTYANTDNCSIRASLESDDGVTSGESFYTITVAANGDSATTYLLTATAVKSPQLSDSGCTTMTLSHTGARTPAACW